jgi:hypothetical protein
MKADRALVRSALVVALVAVAAAGAAAADLTCPAGLVLRSSRSTWTNEDWCEKPGGQGTKHGPFRMWSAHGRLEGSYRDGSPEGTWVGYYQEGPKSGEADFQGGVLNGRFRALYSNGKTLAEGVFRNGKAAGPLTFFDPMGRRRLVMTVADDGSVKEQTGYDEAGKSLVPGIEFYRQNIGRSDFLDFVLRMGGVAPLY